MAQQQASIDTVLSILTEQSRKLDGIKADFDKFRDEMPDNYPPRRETDKAFNDVNARINDHEARIRITEGQIASATFNAFRETAGVREKALEGDAQTRASLSQQRQEIDGRTLALYGMLFITLLSLALSLASAHVTFH